MELQVRCTVYFKNASDDRKDHFIGLIELGPEEYDDRAKNYLIYNWCIWLQRVDPTNLRVESINKEILTKYDFIPREHPELDIYEEDSVCVSEKNPVSKQEMLKMSLAELSKVLLTYEEDPFDGPTRWGLLNEFSDCIKENNTWALRVMSFLYDNKIDNSEVWNRVFLGLEESDQAIEILFAQCEVFMKIVEILSDVQCLANYLWKALQSDESQKLFKIHEQKLFALSLKIWNKRSSENPVIEGLINKAINSTTGTILLSWIHMVSHSCEDSIPEQYKNIFEESLQLKSWEREVAICILAGHFNFFCYRDMDWCIKQFEPMLIGTNETAYMSAWEGMVHFSRRINKDTADIVIPIFLKAVRKISILKETVRNGFLELYLILLIYVVDKPTQKFIPELYKFSSEEIHIRFIKTIEYRLKNMDEQTKITWWHNWLKQFIENRKKNKPVELTELECQSLFMLLPELSFVFDEATTILCKGILPSKLDYLFWYELNEGNYSNEHSHSMVMLLIKVLGSITGLDSMEEEYIISIIQKMHDLNDKEKYLLQEALLRHRINIIIN